MLLGQCVCNRQKRLSTYQHVVKTMDGETNAMVCHPRLHVVVRANSFRPVSSPDLCAAVGASMLPIR